MPQVTVYIREQDLDLWKALPSKAEFISNCLRGVAPQLDVKPNDRVSMPINIPGVVTASSLEEPEVVVPACCGKTHIRCKHWQFNDLDETWTNYITGEIREA